VLRYAPWERCVNGLPASEPGCPELVNLVAADGDLL
jgi:hypothetical protein